MSLRPGAPPTAITHRDRPVTYRTVTFGTVVLVNTRKPSDASDPATGDAAAKADPIASPLPGIPRLRGWIHVWSCAVAIVAGAVLTTASAFIRGGDAAWATGIYSLCTCALFGTSAAYHRVPWRTPRAHLRMKRADHSMIFVFIAGTYTAVAPLALPASTALVLLIIVWSGALAGVALKLAWPAVPRWYGVLLYLLLGWAVVFVLPALWKDGGIAAFVLLAVGGVLYSVGAFLYATRRPNPWPKTFGHHEFFHAATAVAALCHYVAIWLILAR